MLPRYTPPLAATVWNAAAVGANGTSAIFDSANCPFCSIFGNTTQATGNILLLASNDGTAFFTLAKQAITAAGNFNFNVTTGARFLQLQTDTAATITAIVSAK